MTDTISEILDTLKHAINNNPSTSNYVFDEDDEAFKTAHTKLEQLITEARLDEARGYHLSNPRFDEYEIVWIDNGVELTHAQRIKALKQNSRRSDG